MHLYLNDVPDAVLVSAFVVRGMGGITDGERDNHLPSVKLAGLRMGDKGLLRTVSVNILSCIVCRS